MSDLHQPLHTFPATSSSAVTGLEQDVLSLINPGEVTAFLQELIRSRSDYPPGDCRAAVQAAADKLSEAGADVEVLAEREHQPNLLAYLGGRQPTASLLYHAHIDTVAAGSRESWSVDPFEGVLKDGRIYGRGAGDDKGSVAAQVMAVVTLARAGVALGGNLQLAAVSDEESDALHGTRWLRQQGRLQTAALVVGEQTGNHVAVAERVACGIDLTIYGKTAHGAMPWAGDNAVLKAVRVVTRLQEELFPRLAARLHPFLPPPTLNICKMHGGEQWNIVPDRCKIEMDRRLLPGETREAAMDEIRQVLDAYAREVEPLRYELYSGGDVAPNIDTPPGIPFVTVANQALWAVCGEDRPLSGYVQTSDGRWFAGDGIPIVIFGPSDPAVAHASDEFVTESQLLEAVRFYTLFALRWLSPGGVD